MLLLRLDPRTLLGLEGNPSYRTSPWPCSQAAGHARHGRARLSQARRGGGQAGAGAGSSDRRRESRASRGFTLLPGTRESRACGDALRFTSRQEQGWEVTFRCEGETPYVLAQCPKRSGRGRPDTKLLLFQVPLESSWTRCSQQALGLGWIFSKT